MINWYLTTRCTHAVYLPTTSRRTNSRDMFKYHCWWGVITKTLLYCYRENQVLTDVVKVVKLTTLLSPAVDVHVLPFEWRNKTLYTLYKVTIRNFLYMYVCMYVCMYVYTFGFKPLLGLEPIAPIRPLFPASHIPIQPPRHSYVCIFVCKYVCMYLSMCVCM